MKPTERGRKVIMSVTLTKRPRGGSYVWHNEAMIGFVNSEDMWTVRGSRRVWRAYRISGKCVEAMARSRKEAAQALVGIQSA